MFLGNPLGFTEFFPVFNFSRTGFVYAEKQEIRIKHYENDVGKMRCKYSECKHPAFDFLKIQSAKVEKKVSLNL